MGGPTYELRFDGSCNPNPGGKAGYGWVVYLHDPENHDDPVRFAEGSGPVSAPPGGLTSNNVAEWAALRAGLEWFRCYRAAVGRLLIRGDSRLVIDQLNGGMKCKKPYLLVYRDACRAILRTFRFGHDAAWIPRGENAAADALAGE